MSGRRAKRERKLARDQLAQAKPVTQAVQAVQTFVGPQRYEVLHYLRDVTSSANVQAGQLLGRDEVGRPYEVLDAEYTPWTLAEDHFDGDGCTFPSPGHFLRSGTTVHLQYATPENIRAAMAAAGITA